MFGNSGDRNLHEIIGRAMQDKATPALVMDAKLVKGKYYQIREALHGAGIYYAVKANPHPEVLKSLYELGAGFEIASEGQLEPLLRLGVPPCKIISSNPVKTPDFIRSAYASEIAFFALDSYTEIEKLSKLAPRSKVYVRLTVSNEGSEWPLDRKFGVDTEEAIELLIEAKKQNLEPYGIAFHVGSQCTNPSTWTKAIEKSGTVWESVRNKGIDLQLINIGGGFPCKYTKPVPSIAEISQAIDRSLAANFPQSVEVVAEPGRALVGEAGILVATVIAKAMRNEQQWVYLDAGVFNGLMETIGGIEYEVIASKEGVLRKCVLAGPSCDSMDIISENVGLPELDIGDKVYIMSAGAYTTGYASQFDGFPIPDVYFTYEEPA